MKKFLTTIGLGASAPGGAKADNAFEQLKQASMLELKTKTEANTGWGLGKFDEWDLNQDKGSLEFSNADGTKAKMPAQVIGSYDTRNGSWQWAWANASVYDKLKEDSLKVRQYGKDKGFKKLTKAVTLCSEDEAWAMAAIACKICGAQGVYRGPASDSLYVFMDLGAVELSRRI
jgi:hypothetical protein